MKHGTNRWENCTSWTPKGWPTNLPKKNLPKRMTFYGFLLKKLERFPVSVSGLNKLKNCDPNGIIAHWQILQIFLEVWDCKLGGKMSETKTSYHSFGRVLILINQEDMVFSNVITTQKHTLCLFFLRIFMTMHANKNQKNAFTMFHEYPSKEENCVPTKCQHMDPDVWC